MQPTQDHHPLIKVSELTQYLLCPRLVYFATRGDGQPDRAAGKERNAIEHILFKELGFNLSKLYGADTDGGDAGKNEVNVVKGLIAEILEGVEWIYKDELKTLEHDLFEVVKNDFLSTVGNIEWLSLLTTENELVELERSYGYEREHIVVSEKLGLVGNIDKLIQTEEEVVPCMIKTGRSPEYGIWKSDRMQLAAYAMLIEDEFETTVQRGFIEYIRTPDIRESHVKKRDRALAIQILKRVRRVKGGVYPEKGENAPCDSCAFVDRCEAKRTLLSKLFGT